jgi:hypothetical protein
MSLAAEPMTFDVRYDDATLRAAAWVFMSRAAFGPRGWLLALGYALGGGGLAANVAKAGWSFPNALGLSVFVVFPLILAFGYGAHVCGMRAKTSRMAHPGSRVTLTDDEIEIAADAGLARFAWRSFSARMERRGVMLLLLSANQFLTLPLRDVPIPAQAFLRRKVPKLAA